MKRINIKCPYCGSRAYLRPSSVVYGDHTDDEEAKLYVCARYPACDAYVAAHKDTLLPMGTLADRNLRRKRMEAHSALNRLISSGLMDRHTAGSRSNWACRSPRHTSLNSQSCGARG